MRQMVTLLLLLATVVVLGMVVRRSWWNPAADARTQAARKTRQPVAADQPGSGRDAPSRAPARGFAEVSAEAGVVFTHEAGAHGEFRLPEQLGPGGAFLDYDNDDDYDIYLIQGGEPGGGNQDYRNRLFRNVGGGRFEDVSEGSGADVPGYGMGCSAADYDNDGDVDLYVTRLGPNVLLRNQGDGTFLDVSDAAGVADPRCGSASAFLDYDRDGLLDLMVVNYVQWSAEDEPPCYDGAGNREYCSPRSYAPTVDVLYRNLGDGRFEDATSAAGLSDSEGNGLGVICTDFNGDGWVDMFVANDLTPGFLWVNQQDGTFREEGKFSGCAYSGEGLAIAGMGVAAEDLDHDGDYDLLVMNIRGQAHLCLRNDGGSFADVSHAWGFGGWSVPYTAFGVAMFDQDHDGLLDAFVANGAIARWTDPLRKGRPYAEPNHFVRGQRGGPFQDATAEVGLPLRPIEMSRGAIMGDYDNDGDIDVLVTNNRGPARLLNNRNDSRAWTMLDLLPASGGRHAINARIELLAGGKTCRREVRPHAGYLGSNDPRVHVGLGDAAAIERLTITWSKGDRETWEDLPVNRHLQLRQGRAPAFTTLCTGGQDG